MCLHHNSRFGLPATRLERRRLLALLASLSPCSALAYADPPMRIAFSESMLAGINASDARAAMSIWMKKISQEGRFEIEFEPRIFDTSEQLQRRLRAAQIDAAALNILEYRPVASLLDQSQVLQEQQGQDMRYVLLVADPALQRVRDLQGGRIALQEGRTSLLVPTWLRTLIGAEPPERFFSSVVSDFKPAQVILPVFFGRADACVTSQRQFQTMCELNPQVGRKLRILELSPDLIITMYAFRKGYRSTHRDRLITELSALQSTTVGRQLMTMFQITGIHVRDVSTFRETLRIIELAERLKAGHA